MPLIIKKRNTTKTNKQKQTVQHTKRAHNIKNNTHNIIQNAQHITHVHVIENIMTHITVCTLRVLETQNKKWCTY